MLDRGTIEPLRREELIALVLRQQQQIEELRQLVEELLRKGKRQASPFSKGEAKPNATPPGRKPGQGPFRHRSAPDPATYSHPVIEVPVAEQSCPDCGGNLEADGKELVTTTEIPPQPKPEVHAYHVAICRCQRCGKRVRGRHPDLGNDQYGATAHRIGNRAMAMAHWLHYGVGIPHRKVPGIFTEIFGIRLTQSAVTQDALKRSAGSIGTAYRQIAGEIATRDQVFADDTGWRIGGSPAWLMGFSSAFERVYQIRRHHSNTEVREVIGSDYQGVLQTDRFTSYDAKELANVRQQKCLAHIQRNLTDLIEQQHGRAGALPRRLKDIFREAIELWHQRTTSKDFAKRATAIQQELTHLLRPRRLRNAANNRMVNQLGWHDDRGNLLRFLDDPEHVEPTNNEAERALRPAVIARKLSQCSKNDAGADAHAKFTSVIATVIKRGATSVVDALCSSFTTGTLESSFLN